MDCEYKMLFVSQRLQNVLIEGNFEFMCDWNIYYRQNHCRYK